MGYVIVCQDGPGQYWYILGSERFEAEAHYRAEHYRNLLGPDCVIRVQRSGQH